MKYFKLCPSCGNKQVYKIKPCLDAAVKKNTRCLSCSNQETKSGERNSFYGKSHTPGSREKIRISSIGRKNMLGKHHTKKTRQQMSSVKLGDKNGMYGKHNSPEAKRKLRIKWIDRMLRGLMNHGLGVDRGATEYFNGLNRDSGCHIQHPNIEIKDLGYFVDGYDPIAHTVYEYDTPYHSKPCKRKRDLARQNEIIDYYKSIGNPLNNFYRINKTNVGKEDMIDVLK